MAAVKENERRVIEEAIQKLAHDIKGLPLQAGRIVDLLNDNGLKIASLSLAQFFNHNNIANVNVKKIGNHPNGAWILEPQEDK